MMLCISATLFASPYDFKAINKLYGFEHNICVEIVLKWKIRYTFAPRK